MMEISIGKMKTVIDELQIAGLTYKRQLDAFEKILHEYQSMDGEGKDKYTLRKIFQDLQSEYQSIKEIKNGLEEIVRIYDNAEKNIKKGSLDTIDNSLVFKRIDIEETKKILDKYNIKIT